MEQESMVFTMLDHGNGIRLKNLEQIYQRFRKLDESINSLNTGSGLGLSVSKALCELLGGKLELESEEGKGSAFTIRIPELEAQDEDDDVLFSDEELF
jgi:signal transduction histidine kinase